MPAQGGNNTGGALFVLDVVSGAARKLLDNFQGLQFNSPNDVVVSRDGVIYFTDPSYGLQQKFRTMMQVGDYVWRFNARTGDTSIVDEKFLQVRLSLPTLLILFMRTFALLSGNKPDRLLHAHTLHVDPPVCKMLMGCVPCKWAL